MEMYNSSANFSTETALWNFKGRVDFVDRWFLMTNPLPLLAIWTSYLLFVLKVGPNMMKSRSAYNLNNVLALYNLVQVIVSAYLFSLGIKILKPNGLVNSGCYTRENVLMGVTSGIYYYLSAKISELLDTVFFILRKKQTQVTFLHVYHHSAMIWFTWIALKYDPTYSVVFLGTINSLVHVVMYAYYGLSAFPALIKYLWWKKYITMFQLVQFFLILLHAAVNFAFGCPPSSLMFSIIVSNAALFIFLFGDFYFKSYTRRQMNKKLL